jgi:TfoX/Sxy family transcriptional regulator of competence genes
MAYDAYLVERVRRIFSERYVEAEERRMMGGLCFMVDDKMCVCVKDANLMARIGPDLYEEALQQEGIEPVGGGEKRKPMTGFVMISPEAIDLDEQLESWVEKCLAYNPIAQSSKQKASKQKAKR